LKEVHAHISKRSLQLSDLSWRDCDCQGGTPAAWSVETIGIVQIMKGQDGLIRAAVVKITSRDRQHLVLKRPIQMLNQIESRCESTEINPSKAPLDSDPYEPLPEDDVTEQVRRKGAALKKVDEAGES